MNRLMNYGILCVVLAGAMPGCQPSSPADSTDVEATVHSEHGGQPNLTVTPAGELLLSWVEYLNDTTDALVMSRQVDGNWSDPVEIARGANWFVNWADFPSLVAFPDGQSLAAHWLQKSDAGTYDYDVRIAISKDAGATWSESFIAHSDGVPAEHGFVSMIPVDSNRIMAVWLDGRHMKSGEGHGHDHGSGAMTLRAAEFDVDGKLYAEAELDKMVCECCQTDAVMTSAGPIVVYRDRSSEEIRDISYVRRINGQWTKPKTLFADNWEIAGCPVNGPAVSAHGDKVAVAWFSAPEGVAQVNVIFSEDGGASFGNPVRVDDGKPIGRVDVEVTDDEHTLISWVENTDGGGSIRFRYIDSDGSLGSSEEITGTTTSRRSGFPVIAMSSNRVSMAMTTVDDGGTSVRSLLLSMQ